MNLKTLYNVYQCLIDFMYEETEAQSGEVTCLWSPCRSLLGLQIEPRCPVDVMFPLQLSIMISRFNSIFFYYYGI